MDDSEFFDALVQHLEKTQEAFEPQEGWERLAPDLRRRPVSAAFVSRTWMRWAGASLAAAAVLVFAGIHVWHGVSATEWETKVIAPGNLTTLVLSDGTQMTVNAGSTVRYPLTFGVGARDVYLTGEALFAVVHDNAHPFSVHVANVVVRDIGTTFDVKAYPEGGMTRITVAEGTVVVGAAQGPGEARARPARLAPTLNHGDMAIVSDTGVMVTHGVDVADFTGWVQGRLTFDGTPLREVVQDIGRTFNITITIADSTLAQHRVTATFDNETIGQILDALTDVIGARYERAGRTVVIRSAVSGARTVAPKTLPLVTTVNTHE